MKIKLLLLGFLCMGYAWSQQISYSPKDSLLFISKMEALKEIEASSLGNNMIFIGKSFLGTPYVEKTLEIGEKESLVINLQGLDCTTFVENTLALNLLRKSKQSSFEDFAEQLETIRYRNGQVDGYSSRLHYFTDWIRTNERKGLVEDITATLGGIELNKPINFMGTHRDLYPFLKDETNYKGILETEKELAKETLCYLPQDQIRTTENKIQPGDIIALATAIKGLDVTHTGIAIRQPNGRIHLLHASSSGEVKITKEPLVDYLKKIKNNIGIMVARPTLN